MATNLRNQIGRIGYGNPAKYVEGQHVEGEAFGFPRLYPKIRSVWELELDGELGDGVYGATLTRDDSGVSFRVEITRTAGFLDPEPDAGAVELATIEAVLDAWTAQLLATDGILDLVESATVATPVVTITFRVPGQEHTIDDLETPTDVAQVTTFTIGTGGDGDYTIPINAEEFTHTTSGADTTEEIRDALIVLINAGAEPVTAAPISTDQIEVTADVAGEEFTHPIAAQVILFTVVDNDAGLTRVAINGTNHDITVVAETIEQIRDFFVGAINGGAQAAAVTAAPISTDQFTVTADVAGTPFTWALTTPSSDITADVTNGPVSATDDTENVDDVFTATEVQEPVGVPIPVGRALVLATVDGHENSVRLPAAADALSVFAGVTLRPHTHPPRQSNPSASDGTEYVSGDEITPVERCDAFAAKNVGTVAAAAGGLAYVVVNVAGGQELGQFRSNDDGANAVLPTSTVYTWLEAVPVNGIGLMRVRR